MDRDNRPNSKELLKQIEMDERLSKKGRLKIFFGYAAGVGKTYSMLEEAHELLKNGVDVVVGYVEPHTRVETLELLEGLDMLEVTKIKYKGIFLKEFDLNKALERNPDVLLVDELPHTNPPFFRHNKRWQDIEELLNAGISVYTTLNVQHLESLNDVIASITGVFVKETVPDRVVEQAHKIELIDIATDDLRARFDEGKIYKSENIEKAKANFFTKENLQALRELSLRKTADAVNNEIQNSRLSKNNINILHTKEKILACISTSPTSTKVIRTASRMASSFKTSWIAVYVENPNSKNMTNEEKQRLRDNLNLAEKLGAQIEIIHGNDIVEQLLRFCNYKNITKIIIGRNARKKNVLLKLTCKDIVDKLIEEAKYIEVHVIPTFMDGNYKKKFMSSHNINAKSLKEKLKFSKKDFWVALIISLLATFITLFIGELGFAEANILLVYILSVLIISVSTKGYGIGILAAFVNVFCFNFLFTNPRLAFNFIDPTYIVTFPFFILVATITSTLTTRLKEQSEISIKGEEVAQFLYQISKSFINLSGEMNIINTGIYHICEGLKRGVTYYQAENGNLTGEYIFKRAIGSKKRENVDKRKEMEIAYWVAINRKHAGSGTDTHNGMETYFIPITSVEESFGVLAVECSEKLSKDELSLIEAVVAQMTLALDREKLSKEKEKTKLEIEREKLRSNLLRAISHDLRTPLTGIQGASSLILKSYDSLTDNMKVDLIRDINSDSEWLIRLVENLLSMTRIEGGDLKINKTLEVVEEIIAEAVQHIKNRLENHNFKIDIPEEPIFVPMDGKLIEQVIVNLVDNAIKYTPKGSDIIIKVMKKYDKVVFEVRDNGPGIGENDIEHVFDVFYKANTEEFDSRRGIGLGLSICKSIILAHGGEIKAINNKLGGAIFKFTLPIK